MTAALLDQTRAVHATPRFVIVDKPAGVLSVPGKGPANQRSVLDWVRARYPGARGPLVVHRLDMDTSGLLLVALDEESQRALSALFHDRRVEKAYTALVEGHVAFETGLIDVPLRADIERRPHQVVDLAEGRPAVTRWRVLAYEPERTRLHLAPETGRTHQLRVHCAFAGPGGLRGPAGDPAGRGHPILGDVLYGDPDSAPRLLLHASNLCFSDPLGSGRVEVHSPAPF